MDKTADRVLHLWYGLVLLAVAILVTIGTVAVATRYVNNACPWNVGQAKNGVVEHAC